MCFVFIWEQTANCATYSINCLVFITVVESVYRAVRTDSLHKSDTFNLLATNDSYIGRTAQLTSKSFILYIYSTNTGTEYFKRGIYCLFFLFKMQFVS